MNMIQTGDTLEHFRWIEIAMNATHLRPLKDLTLWIQKGFGLFNSNLQIKQVFSIERDELS